MTSYPSSNTSFSSTTTSPSSTSSQTSPPTKPAAAAAAAHQPPSSCRVCSGPTTGIWHYGAECCRACASFFQRSIKANRKYVCRTGQNCLISNDEGMRNSCRSCRLKRCLEVGMTLDGLESCPNPMSDSSRQLTRHHPQSTKSNSGGGGVGGPEMIPQFLSPNNGGRGEGFDSSLEAKIPLTLQFESSIRQFSNGLRALSIVEGISGNLAGGDNTFKSLTWEDFKRTEKGTILLVYAMIGQHLPAIANFPAESRARLCRIFAPQFSFMNKTEMTQNCLEPNSPYVMLVPGGVVDRNNLDPMMSDVQQTPEQREHFRKNFVAHFEFDCLKYRPLEITPLEFAALSAILFWNSVEFAVSEFVPAEEYGPKREALFAELNAIVEERQQRRLGCFQNGNINASSFSSSVAIRFGQLMHFLHQLGTFTSQISEEAAINKIFMNISDIYDDISLPST